jgi:Xaa-Pro aminopeptidase
MLSLRERDRRWAGLRDLMRLRQIDAVIVGSFQGRERLESYLIDDFLDSVVVLPVEADPTVLTFSPSRTSRVFESKRRGFEPWVDDFRIGFGGAKVAEILREKGLPNRRVGCVGFGPTAPGEMEGLLPLGFHQSLVAALDGIELLDFTRDFTDFILVKSPEEIELLRFAAHVSDQAALAMIAACKPGISEAEVYAEIMREIHRWGCDTRYPFLSLQSGPDNISWGAPRWMLRAEPPRILQRGDLVQAEIHTAYGGQEAQVQICVLLDPVAKEIETCESVSRLSYQAAIETIKPGIRFADVVEAMEKPLRDNGCWAKTPLIHTLTFGATGFTPVNRHQLAGTREELVEGQAKAGIRRGDLILKEGMGLELEPNACIGMRRVNIGGSVIITRDGCEELNPFAARAHRVTA